MESARAMFSVAVRVVVVAISRTATQAAAVWSGARSDVESVNHARLPLIAARTAAASGLDRARMTQAAAVRSGARSDVESVNHARLPLIAAQNAAVFGLHRARATQAAVPATVVPASSATVPGVAQLVMRTSVHILFMVAWTKRGWK